MSRVSGTGGPTEEQVLTWMEKIRYARTEDIARLHFGDLLKFQAKEQRSKKELCRYRLAALRELGKLTAYEMGSKQGNLYRWRGWEGLGSPHLLAVTSTLIDILRIYPEADICREIPIPNMQEDKRPDAAVLVKEKARSIFFFLEVCLTEPKEQLIAKMQAYGKWECDNFRSWALNTFGAEVHNFGMLVIGKHKIQSAGVRCAEKFERGLL